MQILRQIQLSVNIMTDQNFPHPLTGNTLIRDQTLSLRKTNIREWYLPLVSGGSPVTTTTATDCGGFFNFNPADFPNVRWFFEVALQTATGGTATAQLRSSATILSNINSTNTGWSLIRSTEIIMPSTTSLLTVHLQSSATTITSGLWVARLVIHP